MTQAKLFLNRLKKPSVVLSIVSQILILLSLFKVNVDVSLVNGVVGACLSILVTLGIMSNPDTTNKMYSDKIEYCPTCDDNHVFSVVAGQHVCTNCNTPLSQATE